MHELLEQVTAIANKIKSLEDSRERLGSFLRDIKGQAKVHDDGVLEAYLVYQVKPDPLLNKRIIGIDGGLAQRACHGIDLILTRAVAAIFDYNKKLAKVTYYPSPLVIPKLVIITDPYSDEELRASSSLIRQKTEIDLAISSFKKFSPDMLLLDGPVLPHAAGQSGACQELINSFEELYALASGRFAGCIEDSRSRKFCDIIARTILSKIKNPTAARLQKILAGTRDTNLLYHVLGLGERTCIFRQHGEIFSFYLKTAEFDRPVRIDFYCERDITKTADRIAAIVLATSCHSSYGFPAPLIEADLRAKLAEHELSSLHEQLVDHVGVKPSLLKLRRESRPF